MRHSVLDASIEGVTETALIVLGDERVILRKEKRLEHLLDGLEEADKQEIADAQGQLEEANVRQKAARDRLREVEHRAIQKAAIRQRIKDLNAESERALDEGIASVKEEAVAAGYRYSTHHPHIPNGSDVQAVPAIQEVLV